jgi:hypothetical protein
MPNRLVLKRGRPIVGNLIALFLGSLFPIPSSRDENTHDRGNTHHTYPPNFGIYPADQ